MFTHDYSCLPFLQCFYLCLALFTRVYSFLPVFSRAFLLMFTHVYSSLPVYPYLPVYVYSCSDAIVLLLYVLV